MARPLARDEAGLTTFWSFVGVVVLVLAILGVYFAYLVPRFAPPPIRAQSGDQVEVDYIGSFVDTSLVFDTSLLSVAADNATYEKAFTFGWREPWNPLRFTVGIGAVVRGFDLGVQGLAVGDAKTVVVPFDQGYGAADPSKLVVKTLFESVPVRLTMNATDFQTAYNTQAVSGTNVSDPFWGWTATVSVAGSVVTVTNSPVPGDVVRPYGAWDARVLSIDDAANEGVGEILVRHLLTSGSVDRVGQKDSAGRVVFAVTSVDVDAGTYTLNYNEPLMKGRTMIFQVTMVRISRLF